MTDLYSKDCSANNYTPGAISSLGGYGGSLVVASADASSKIKEAADFVCDGINDEVEINQAILALDVAGLHMSGMPIGCVQLTAGQFKIKNPILMHGGVTLQGFNDVSTVIFAEADETTTDDTYAAIGMDPDPPVADGYTASYGFMTVRDLGMWGGYDGWDGGTRTNSTGIDFTTYSPTANILIYKCRIKGFNNRSVKLANTLGSNQVIKCHFESRIPLADGVTNIAVSGGDLISGCTFTHDGASTIGFDSAVQPGTGTKIENCLINDTGQAGIVGGSVKDVIISNNRFTGSQKRSASGNAPIYLFSNVAGDLQRIQIVNNNIICEVAAEFYGMRIVGATNCVIEGNIIEQFSGSTGIRCDGSLNNITNNIIKGANTHGVRLDTSNYCNVSGNITDVDGGSTTNGVSSTGGDNNSVIGNSSNGASNPTSLVRASNIDQFNS